MLRARRLRQRILVGSNRQMPGERCFRFAIQQDRNLLLEKRRFTTVICRQATCEHVARVAKIGCEAVYDVGCVRFRSKVGPVDGFHFGEQLFDVLEQFRMRFGVRRPRVRHQFEQSIHRQGISDVPRVSGSLFGFGFFLGNRRRIGLRAGIGKRRRTLNSAEGVDESGTLRVLRFDLPLQSGDLFECELQPVALLCQFRLQVVGESLKASGFEVSVVDESLKASGFALSVVDESLKASGFALSVVDESLEAHGFAVSLGA